MTSLTLLFFGCQKIEKKTVDAGELQKIIQMPPLPHKVHETLRYLDELQYPDDPVTQSLLKRTRAVVLMQQPDVSLATVLAELNAAEQVLTRENLKDTLTKKAYSKIYLNRGLTYLHFLHRRLQKVILYPPEQQDEQLPFQLVDKYFAQASAALSKGKSFVAATPLYYDFVMAEANLAREMALLIGHSFIDANNFKQSFQMQAIESYKEIHSSFIEGKCPPDTGIAALHNAVLVHLEKASSDPDLWSSLINQLESLEKSEKFKKLLRTNHQSILAGTIIELYRRKSAPEKLLQALRKGETVFQKLLREQTALFKQRNYAAATRHLDDYGHLVASIVMGYLDLGENYYPKALAAAQSSKWITQAISVKFPISTIEGLTARLSEENSLYVEYFIAPEGLVTFIVKPDGTLEVIREQNTTTPRLLELIHHFRKNISDYSVTRRLERNPNDINEWLTTLKLGDELRKILVDNPGLLNNEYNRIYIAPHLTIQSISFATLPVEINYTAPLKSRFLIDTAPPITFIPSLNIPDQPSGNPKEKHDALYLLRSDFTDVKPNTTSSKRTFGDLPDVIDEVSRCREIFPGKLLKEKQATEKNFWRHASVAKLIYFATHGDFTEDNPYNSPLLLAKGSWFDRSDGRLTVSELLEAHLNQTILSADLVVMSACSTAAARARPLYSNDLSSVARTFLVLGAKNVMGTQWEAAGETYVAMMPQLIRYYKNGNTAPDALWLAQKEYLDNERKNLNKNPKRFFAMPFYWGSAMMFSRL